MRGTVDCFKFCPFHLLVLTIAIIYADLLHSVNLAVLKKISMNEILLQLRGIKVMVHFKCVLLKNNILPSCLNISYRCVVCFQF